MPPSSFDSFWVSTHSRLKAAGGITRQPAEYAGVSTHSRLKAAGGLRLGNHAEKRFQHTAA